MLPSLLCRYARSLNRDHLLLRGRVAESLLISRQIHNVQTIGYDVTTVSSVDLDPSGEYLLVGSTVGNIALNIVTDGNDGTVSQLSELDIDNCNIQRVQWDTSMEQIFSVVDTHSLSIVDSHAMQLAERHEFGIRTCWSDWNTLERKLIGVCGTGSQLRVVDLRTGSSLHSITMSSKSGLRSHRVTRCLWSKLDSYKIYSGDNDGMIHMYDIRHCNRPVMISESDKELGQVSGMSFTSDNMHLISSHGARNEISEWHLAKGISRIDKEFPKVTAAPRDSGLEHPIYRHLRPDLKPKEKFYPTETAGPSGQVGTRKRRKLRNKNAVSPDTHLRCQFYVSENLVFVPAHSGTNKSIELFINCIRTGELVKVVKSEDIFVPGTNCVTGFLPDGLFLYVGGGERFRVWSVDEDFERKMRERLLAYEREEWDTDDEF